VKPELASKNKVINTNTLGDLLNGALWAFLFSPYFHRSILKIRSMFLKSIYIFDHFEVNGIVIKDNPLHFIIKEDTKVTSVYKPVNLILYRLKSDYDLIIKTLQIKQEMK
jgi:hypothetical protein